MWSDVDVDVNGVLRLDKQAQLGSDLFMWEEAVTGVNCGAFLIRKPASAFLSGVDGCVDFAGDVAVGVASPAILAGGVAVGVAPPAVAGVVTLADPAGGVTVGVLLGWRPQPFLGWRPRPLLGWRRWPTLLELSPSVWHP